MGSQLILVLLVLASGFVAAGLLNAIHQSVVTVDEGDGERPFVLYFDTPGAIAWSMLMCVFAGPYLVLSNGLYFWRQKIFPGIGVAVCALLSAIWSFCSGVFIVEVVSIVSRL